MLSVCLEEITRSKQTSTNREPTEKLHLKVMPSCPPVPRETTEPGKITLTIFIRKAITQVGTAIPDGREGHTADQSYTKHTRRYTTQA